MVPRPLTSTTTMNDVVQKVKDINERVYRILMKASVTCIIDEGAKVNTALIGSKGSSFMFEVDDKRILFNTGRSGRYLIHNMGILGFKADSVDTVIISCPKIDQIGGLNNFMTNRTVPVDVYAVPEAWDCKRLMGGLISEDNIGGVKKQPAGDDWIRITDHLFLSPCVNGDTKETILVLRTTEGAAVFCACAESGISDVLAKVKGKFGVISTFVGGIRMKKSKQPAVNALASEIRDTYGVMRIYLDGCTTAEGIQKMRIATANDKIKDFFVGDVLEFTV